jgi:glycoprotein-N-acetylgalactosamine 3-beta-galactosyltransferase
LAQQSGKVKALASKVRILCWIMTQPNNHESHAMHVKATWGKRCNILFFVSTVENDTLPSIAYKGNESRSILWGKTKLAFQVSLQGVSQI